MGETLAACVRTFATAQSPTTQRPGSPLWTSGHKAHLWALPAVRNEGPGSGSRRDALGGAGQPTRLEATRGASHAVRQSRRRKEEGRVSHATPRRTWAAGAPIPPSLRPRLPAPSLGSRAQSPGPASSWRRGDVDRSSPRGPDRPDCGRPLPSPCGPTGGWSSGFRGGGGR